MSLFESASLVVTPNGTKASKLYSVKPTDGSGDMTVTRATTATRVNSSGVIESVATNVPRLDYTGSSCPSILIEPQRTNLLLRSEQFEFATWGKLGTTVTSDTTISPDGTQNADSMTLTDSNSRLSVGLTLGAGTYTLSFYVKKLSTTSGSTMRLLAVVDTLNVSVNFTPTEEWERYSYTFTATTSVTAAQIRAQNLIGNVAVWGAQLEVGSNATSYIPTTTATVTRNADVITKTGITDLIGQTEGTLYADINFKKSESGSRVLALGDSTSSNRIVILEGTTANTFRLLITNAGISQADIVSSAYSIGNYKIAVAYKNNDIVLYINGSQIGTDNSATIPACSNLYLGRSESSLSVTTLILNDSIKSAALWKTRLTNAELATLTTI